MFSYTDIWTIYSKYFYKIIENAPGNTAILRQRDLYVHIIDLSSICNYTEIGGKKGVKSAGNFKNAQEII